MPDANKLMLRYSAGSGEMAAMEQPLVAAQGEHLAGRLGQPGDELASRFRVSREQKGPLPRDRSPKTLFRSFHDPARSGQGIGDRIDGFHRLVELDEVVVHDRARIEVLVCDDSVDAAALHAHTEACFGKFQNHWRTFVCEARTAELENETIRTVRLPG
jgi:hypothetical protein